MTSSMLLWIIYSCVLSSRIMSSAGGLVSRSNLETTLRTAFASERSPAAEGQKVYVRKYITDFFTDLDGGSSEHLSRQHFSLTDLNAEHNNVNGTNLIWILPGERYGTPQDSLFFIGSHYDSVIGTSGVDDNGSGMAVMLEIARGLAKESTCTRKNSLMFVAFDFEERYSTKICSGSEVFVEEYFVPEILEKFNIAAETVKGGVVLETILNYDETPGSQIHPPGLDVAFPQETAELIANQNKSDHIFVLGRQNEVALAKDFIQHWNASFTKGPMDLMIPVLYGRPSDNPLYDIFYDFYRSDHYSFWNSPSKNVSLIPMLFITDTANLRGYMTTCYHTPCDDVSHLTEPRLRFIHETAESVALISQMYSCETDISGCEAKYASSILSTVCILLTLLHSPTF